VLNNPTAPPLRAFLRAPVAPPSPPPSAFSTGTRDPPHPYDELSFSGSNGGSSSRGRSTPSTETSKEGSSAEYHFFVLLSTANRPLPASVFHYVTIYSWFISSVHSVIEASLRLFDLQPASINPFKFDEMKGISYMASVNIWDIIGAYVAVFLAMSAVPEVLRFTRQIAPMLPMSTVSRARRLSLWFFALFFHSLNTILYVLKVEVNLWILLIKCYTSATILAVSVWLLVPLRQTFPLRQYFWMVGGTFVIVCAPSVMLAMSSSQSAIGLEIINIPLTLLVNILHFSAGGLF
ncbi:unnamed protein product, partial [Urochloa humidicola]